MLVVICTPVPKGNSFEMRRVKVHHRYTRSLWIETELNHADLENCALLAYGVSGQPDSPGFFTVEGRTDRLSRNVGKELPLLAP